VYIELLWDDEAVEHIDRHNVTPAEVEDVVYETQSLILRTRQDRYMVYGQTSSGRYLKVVIEPLRRGRFYPVTAYEMDDTDRQLYQRKSRR
jgi:hypothetical protein